MNLDLWPLLLLAFIPLLLFYFRITIKASLVSTDLDQLINMSIASTFGILQKDYRYSSEDILSLLPGFRPMNEVPKPGLATRLIQFPNKLSEKLQALKDSLFMASRVFKWLVIEKIEWKTRAGSKDAMETAIMIGVFWSFKGAVIGAISSRTRLQKLIINIEPDFNKPGINSYLVCILKMRIVHIIIIASFVLVLKVRGYLNGYSK